MSLDFCLDGKRLEAVAGVSTGTIGAYGARGTEYRTLVDSFAKIVSHVEPGNGIQLGSWLRVPVLNRAAQGPDFFTVATKEGRVLTFGKTRDALVLSRSGVRYAWLLSRVEDRAQNTIDIHYTNLTVNVPAALSGSFPNVVRPSVIAYTGSLRDNASGGNVGQREVRFSYETRGDPRVIFRQGGVPYIVTERLSRISTFVGSTAVKSYRLQYGAQAQSQIQQIVECAGNDDQRCKAPTRFDYQEESGFTLGPAHLDIASAAALDANGDGVPDFLTTKIKVNGVASSDTLAAAQISADVAVGVASAAFTPAVGLAITAVWTIIKGPFWGLFSDDPTVEFLRTMQLATGNAAVPLRRVDDVQGLRCEASAPTFLFDYDRDGKDDVLAACGFNAGSIFVARSRGDGSFDSLPSDGSPVATVPIAALRWTGSFGQTISQDPPVPILFDVDGDSLQDLVSCKDRSTLELRRRLGPSLGFESRPIQLISPEPPSGVQQPLCGETRPTYQIFDLDGDGTPDLLARGPAGWQALRYTLPAGGAPSLAWVPVNFPDVNSSQYGKGLSLGDFNGDGLSDVWSAKDDQAIIWLNTGDRRFTSRNLLRPRPALQRPIPFTYLRTAPLDYNADGRTDLLEAWESSITNFNVVLIPDSLVQTLDVQIPRLAVDIRDPLNGGLLEGSFLRSGDINGDGMTDLYGFDAGSFLGSGAHNTLLTRVVDGLGNVVKVDYDAPESYTEDARCTGTTWPEKCLHRINGLVSSHSEGFVSGNGSGPDVGERTYIYHYVNARMNVTGHGWLGFDQRTVSRAVAEGTSRSITTEYEPVARYDVRGRPTASTTAPYLYPLAGLPKTVIVDELGSFDQTVAPLETAIYGRRTASTTTGPCGSRRTTAPFPSPNRARRGRSTRRRPHRSSAHRLRAWMMADC